MDDAGHMPPKRRRTSDDHLNITIHQGNLSNSIWQSNLVQKKLRTSPVITKHVVKSSESSLPFLSTMKFVPNKEINISNKLQKLKLKSSDGRDLGEINVKLLPQNGDGIGGKTLMIKKHIMFNKVEDPTAVSILKPMDKTKNIPTKSRSPALKATKSTLISSTTSCVSVNNIHKTKTIQEADTTKCIKNTQWNVNSKQTSVIDIPKSSFTSPTPKVYSIHVNKQHGLNSITNINKNIKNVTQVPSKPKFVMVRAENYSYSNEAKTKISENPLIGLHTTTSSKDSKSGGESTFKMIHVKNVFPNTWKFVEIPSKMSNQDSKTIRKVVSADCSNIKKHLSRSACSEGFKLISKSKNDSSISSTPHDHQKTVSEAFSTVQIHEKVSENDNKRSSQDLGKKLPIPCIKVKRISQDNHSTADELSSENIQCITSTTNNVSQTNVDKGSNKEVISESSNSDQIKSRPSNTDKDEINSIDKEKMNNDKKLRENIMVILHGNANTLSNKEKCKSESKNDINNMDVDSAIKSNIDVTCTGNVAETNTEDLNNDSNQKHSNSDNIKQNCISSKPDTTLPQQQSLDILQKVLSTLPDQDLREKALKALAECGIGLKRYVPVLPTVCVSDSQTQTTIFSLLNPPSLMHLDETSVDLNRLTVVEKNDTLFQFNYNDNFQLPSEIQPVNNESIFYNDPFPSVTDFSSLLEEYSPETAATQVKEIQNIFSPNPTTLRTFEQAKKDFKAATNFDCDGFLGIHIAVLNGNIREVRRQLIVLKALKENVDVPTRSGKTSLELAVQHRVDPHIVTVLLTAGAKPAFPIKLYESALVIACRMSSVVIPQLIKYVNPPSLFDILDSEGFAPLHYCTQRGNASAVKLLVSAGANVNLRDAKSGRTPLFHALEARNIEIVSYLIDNGASSTIANFAGQLPALLDEYRYEALAEKLIQVVR